VDDSENFQEFINTYKGLHPNITITYKKLRPEEYEKMLLEAWVEDRGPDIYAIKSSWLGKYKNRITPLPDKIEMAYVYEKTIIGSKKEQVIEIKPTAIPTLKDFKDNYLKTVYDTIFLQDAQGKRKVYGLPLFVDTLVLYYNQDFLDNANLVYPPKNWEEFNEQVGKLTKFNTKGEIIQPGAALGTTKNIKYSFDLLSVLMMQNLAASQITMTDVNGQPLFNRAGLEKGYYPGEVALVYYTDFAQPTKQVYSWNETFPLDLDAFQQNQVAFFFGYSQDLPQIKAGARFDFGLTPLPQLNSEAPVNFANYWLQTVSFKSKNADKAWDFILYLSQKDNLKKYLEKTKRPTPIKSLIEEQKKDLEMAAFAEQLLTAQSWYRGRNFEVAQGAFGEMIDSVLKGEQPRKAINVAIQKINQTY
jgi:ABC-type glycerol-3-phosphate transport system substrate-binding protein